MARPNIPLVPRKTGQSRLAQAWREARRDAGLDQRQLAEKLDCSNTHISNIEHGRRLPKYDLVERFDELVGSEGFLRSLWEWAYTERAAGGHRELSAPGRQLAGDRSEFVQDVTMRDGTIIGVDEAFTKIWRLRNSGTVVWRDRLLRRAGPHAPRFGIHSPVQVPVPDTPPGQTADIKMRMRAPSLPGDCVAHFYMTHSDGALCFPDLYPDGAYVYISVRAPRSMR